MAAEKNGLVAQLVEQATLNRQVVGSNPTWSTIVTGADGVSPSGKATDSDSVTAGSNPATPANTQKNFPLL